MNTWQNKISDKMLAPSKKSYDKPRQHIKKQRYHFVNKSSYNQSYGFSSSHIQMWELNHKHGWVPKNWCLQTVVLGLSLVQTLGSKEIKPVNPKGNQPWIFIERTVAEAEAPIFWPLGMKSWPIGKDSDAGKDWRQRIRWWLRMRWIDNITTSMDMNWGKSRR